MDRKIDTLSYLSPTLQQIKEYQVIASTLDKNYEKLKKERERIFDNSFISFCDTKGIKRWEQLLKIVPDTNDLEQRKQKVLGKWNRTLPYTEKQLRQYLDLLVGKDEYRLNTDYLHYLISIIAEDKNISAMQAIKEMVHDMKPANIILYLENSCHLESNTKLNFHSQVDLETEYSIFPRILRNYMNGSVKMGGSHQLNAYKEKLIFKLYQSALEVETALQQNILLKPVLQLEDRYQITNAYATEMECKTKCDSNLLYQAELEQELKLESATWYLPEIRLEDTYSIKNRNAIELGILAENRHKIKYLSGLEQETTAAELVKIEPEIKLEDTAFNKETYQTKLEQATQKEVKLDYQAKLEQATQEEVKPAYICGMTLEINRCQMNGAKKMNGTRKMKSAVVSYDAI